MHFKSSIWDFQKILKLSRKGFASVFHQIQKFTFIRDIKTCNIWNIATVIILSPCTVRAIAYYPAALEAATIMGRGCSTRNYAAWQTFQNQLMFINCLNSERRVFCFQPSCSELHGFSDASQAAYGFACIYIRNWSVWKCTCTTPLCENKSRSFKGSDWASFWT